MSGSIMQWIRPSHTGDVRFDANDPLSVHSFSLVFRQLLRETVSGSHTPLIILCIGTDRSTGDALGPLTGSKLEEYKLPRAKVFGTLEHPVHASNLVSTLEMINLHYHAPAIIAVDACLGRMDSVGYITLGKGPLKPGAGVNKDLPAVGDLFVTGIVNVGGFMEHFVLQNTRLHLVMKMADTIASGIAAALSAAH